jgi:hypothetical protein
MGKIKSGIMGGFSGKVGNVVGASWMGICYMRALPKVKKKRIPTEGQNGQRSKFALIRAILLPINDMIKQRYQQFDKMTPMNSALSYNLKNSILHEKDQLSIDFNNLLFSKGELFPAWSPKVTSVDPGKLVFSWINGGYNNLCSAMDHAVLVIYNSVTERFMWLERTSFRADEQVTLEMSKSFIGSKLHCYLSFFSKERNLASSNQYLGEIVVS